MITVKLELHMFCCRQVAAPLKVYQRRKGVGSKAQTLIWHSLGHNGLRWDLIQFNMDST